MIRLAALLIVLAFPLAAQSVPGAAATEAARQLEAAAELLATADTRRDRVAALTATVQAYEDGLVAMRDGLRRAAIEEAQIAARLEASRTEVAQLLGVLQSMGRAPAPLLLLHPNGPIGTARGGMIAADVTPALQARVDTLRRQLEDVSILRSLQESAADTLRQGLQGAQDARTALSAAIAERTDLPTRFTEDPVQTALLLAATETLDAFATGLSETVSGDGFEVDGAALKGTLPLPVQGNVLRAFNAPDAAGVVRPGVILAARPRALVTTPAAATLLFRGPLLDYENVVIIEPAPDVMIVVAGLAEVFGEAGQILPAGSPIGLMGGDQPKSDEELMQSDATNAGNASQTLYLEVREGQSPVDPATWFALD